MPEQENKALDEQNLDEVSGGNKLDGIKSWGKKHSKALKIGGAIAGTAAVGVTGGVLLKNHARNVHNAKVTDKVRNMPDEEIHDEDNVFGESWGGQTE